MAPLQPKSTSPPAISPMKRDSSTRARVFPGTAGGRESEVAGRRSTVQSTFQTRESETDGAAGAGTRTAMPSCLGTWWHGVRGKYAFWGRYSVGKLQAFSDYQHTHTLPRTLLVLAATPLPSLVALVALLALPLASPTLGASHNHAAFVRSFVSHIAASFGITLVVKQALEFNDRVYPLWRCLLLACAASGINEVLWTSLAVAWRFPIPFRELLCATTWFGWFVLFHYLVMHQQFALKRRRLLVYLPVFTVQFGMFYVFLALAVGFAHCGVAGQVLLVLVIPPLKVAVKRRFWTLTKQLDDLSSDVTVCVVELSSSLYQCLVLPYAASPVIPVLFFVADLTQAALEIALFVDHGFLVRGETAMAVAVDIVAHARAVEAKRLAQLPEREVTSGTVTATRGSTTLLKAVTTAASEGGKRSVASMAAPVVVPPTNPRRHSSGLVKMAEAAARATTSDTFLDFRPGVALPPVTQPPSQYVVDGLPIPRAADARLLTQLLRLLFATEMLLFVEFLEAVLALLYVLVFGLASVLPGGRYVVSLLSVSDVAFYDVLGRALLHAALEIVSFGLVFWLLRRQCGLSTLFQVAYVLEHYWMTIQGKVVTCLLLLLNLATPHQGTDLSFEFVNYNS